MKSSFARMPTSGEENPPAGDVPRDYVPLIQQIMTSKGLHIRDLALKTGINRSRIGLLLHSDPAKRSSLSLVEFQTILSALGINIIQAIITVETLSDQSMLQDERFGTLLAMLAEVFHGLPSMLISALEEIDGIDGTEIRREWATPLKEAVVEKLVKEVTKILARRAVLSETSSIGL